ncbi:hypothetical protein Trydic_g19904 [Trypoxylus dichotomus]
MYRQVQMKNDHKKYQKILWRPDLNHNVKAYELQTVTYGTANVPFLAIRILHQVTDDEQESYLMIKVSKRDFYVNDVSTWANAIEETKTLRNELIMLLKRGGFELRKWSSNDVKLLENFTDICNTELIQLDVTKTQKTLELQWNAQNDVILYNLHLSQNQSPTYDKMYTLLIQTEGCVYSRPRTPIYDDTSNPSVLTPAHCLICAPLTNVPEHDLTDVKLNRLSMAIGSTL